MANRLDKDFENSPLTWMNKQNANKGLTQLLAFADDGIIRGKWQDNAYILSGNVQLRSGTLQRAHLFGPSGELRISRVDSGFEEAWFDNAGVNTEDLLQEEYLLWSEEDGNKGKLSVQHYINYDEYGQAYISHSRLVDAKDS